MKLLRQVLSEFALTLQYHDRLNPTLWDGEHLKPQVRAKLLEFGKTWAKFAGINSSLIKDIVMTGGNANFNYTAQSDIDVHLVIDRSKVSTDPKIIDEYLQDKKTIWTLTHDVKIYTYSIEPYAQNVSDAYPKNQGVYSLKRDTWVVKPQRVSYDFKNDKNLKNKVKHYMHMIDHIIDSNMDERQVEKLKTKLKSMRSSAIRRGGEFSHENLVFKELRNRGYLDKLSKYEKTMKDRQLSLR